MDLKIESSILPDSGGGGVTTSSLSPFVNIMIIVNNIIIHYNIINNTNKGVGKWFMKSLKKQTGLRFLVDA